VVFSLVLSRITRISRNASHIKNIKIEAKIDVVMLSIGVKVEASFLF